MTIIVLDTDDENVVLSADQQWTDGTDLVFYTTKISFLTKGTKAIGAVATAGEGKKGLAFEARIRHAFSKAPAGVDPIDVLRMVCDTSPDKSLTDAIVVVRGRGYHIDEDGLVLPKSRWAIGSGSLVALGAMWTRKGTAERLTVFGCNAAVALTSGSSGSIDTFIMPRAKDS